jgi:hypothetical protein
MSVKYDSEEDRYFVCPQSGPFAIGYGQETYPNCYGGDCSSACGIASGPKVNCQVRERLRDFYADGVQGGSPSCKGQRSDAQTESGLSAPFNTYAINYWGDLDPYRQRPYDAVTPKPASARDAAGHYTENFGCSESITQPLMIRPVPGVPEAWTLSSMAFPGPDNVCTRML